MQYKLKKINQKANYNKLGYKVNDELQINILEKYARKNRAIPLYCFYNYLENTDLSKYWGCPQPYEIEQFGCTITPLKNVRKALSKRTAKKFDLLHAQPETKLLRCLVSCPLLRDIYQQGVSENNPLGFENVTVYNQLPQEFLSALETGNLNRFSSEFYNEEIGIYPKRIMIAYYANVNA